MTVKKKYFEVEHTEIYCDTTKTRIWFLFSQFKSQLLDPENRK